MDKESTKKYNVVIAFLIILSLYLAAITLPISSSKKDISIDISLYQPGKDITWDIAWKGLTIPPVEITNIDATVRSATFLETPSFLGNILYSGNIKVVASTQSVSNVVSSDPILVWRSKELRVVLRSVPISENTLTIKLYNDNALIQTKTVVLT